MTGTDKSAVLKEVVSGTSQRAHIWLDLPANEMLDCIPVVTSDESLKALITRYNAIPKSSLAHVAERRQALEAIAASLEGRDVRILKGLRNTAIAKRNYLGALEKLYKHEVLLPGPAIYDREGVRGYFEKMDGARPPIILNNTEFYDAENARFWGEYWLEIIDPSHRPLEHYKERWKKSGSTSVPFFMWLEECGVEPHIKNNGYFDQPALDRATLKVEDGRLFTAGEEGQSRPLTTNNSIEQLLVVTNDKKIISSPARKGCRHVCLSHGRPVIGIGAIAADMGVVVGLHVDSGHYLPAPHFAHQTAEVLAEIGVDLPPETPVYYFHDFTEYKSTVGALAAELKAGTRPSGVQQPVRVVPRGELDL